MTDNINVEFLSPPSKPSEIWTEFCFCFDWDFRIDDKSKIEVLQDELIVNDEQAFIESGISALQFSEFIASKDPLVIFLNLRLLCKNGSSCNLHSYTDFLHSDYVLVVLVSDVYTVELYTKDDHLLEQIYAIAVDGKADKVTLKDCQDGRQELNF